MSGMIKHVLFILFYNSLTQAIRERAKKAAATRKPHSVSASTKRRLAAEVRASTTATPRSPRRGVYESQASTHRSAASAGTEPRGNAILASLGRDVTRETLASVAASLSQPITQASQVCEC